MASTLTQTVCCNKVSFLSTVSLSQEYELQASLSELATARQNGKMPHRDLRYVDIYNEKPIKVTVKVLVPIKEHPKVGGHLRRWRRRSHTLILVLPLSSTLSESCSDQRATLCADCR